MKGTCLCGAVRYEVRGTPTAFDLCHCSRCRESSGSAFIAELVFEAAQFEWISGASVVKIYEAPTSTREAAGISPDILRDMRWTGAYGGPGRDPHPCRDTRRRSRTSATTSHLRRLQGCMVHHHRWAAALRDKVTDH